MIRTLILLICFVFVCKARSSKCDLCISLLNFTNEILKNKVFENLFVANYGNFCKTRGHKIYCEGIEEFIYRKGYSHLLNSYDNEKYCTDAHLCDDNLYIEDKIDDYTKRVLNSPKLSTRTKQEIPSKKPIRFLAVGDIHIDYHYKEVVFIQ